MNILAAVLVFRMQMRRLRVDVVQAIVSWQMGHGLVV